MWRVSLAALWWHRRGCEHHPVCDAGFRHQESAESASTKQLRALTESFLRGTAATPRARVSRRHSVAVSSFDPSKLSWLPQRGTTAQPLLSVAEGDEEDDSGSGDAGSGGGSAPEGAIAGGVGGGGSGSGVDQKWARAKAKLVALQGMKPAVPAPPAPQSNGQHPTSETASSGALSELAEEVRALREHHQQHADLLAKVCWPALT